MRATNAQPTDPRHILTPATAGARTTTAPNSAPAEQRVPWRWIALWSAVTFCVVLLGMLAVRELRRGDAAPDEASLKARDHMALAESAIKVRAWGRAEEALTVARSLAPQLDLPYAATQARIDSERVNAARLEEARAMRATSLAFLSSSLQPRRILTVTGTGKPFTIASTRRPRCAGRPFRGIQA